MLIEFKFKNYRSFKDEQIFDLRAGSSNSKPDNIFEVTLANGKKLRLLKSAVMYGANASGKTNFIKAFDTFHKLVLTSNQNLNGQVIEEYESFLFDSATNTAPTEFKITWIADNNIVHEYEISYDNTRIYKETLSLYLTTHKSILFERKTNLSDNLDLISLGKEFIDKRISKKVLYNQLFLSKMGGKEGHQQLGEIYTKFRKTSAWGAHNDDEKNWLKENVIKKIKTDTSTKFIKQLSKLLNISDTGIEKLSLKVASKDDFRFPNTMTETEKNQIMKQFAHRPYTQHPLYSNGKAMGYSELPLENNSAGTQELFSLGGLILNVLEEGAVIFYDELDNSLHPMLCRFLISLFHHPKTNPHNAQLIFATHEVSLLDKAIFRKDQIWFAKKDKRGASELYSAQDFDNVRDDTPFDKWYMAGKFGAYPKIKELEFIFDYE